VSALRQTIAAQDSDLCCFGYASKKSNSPTDDLQYSLDAKPQIPGLVNRQSGLEMCGMMCGILFGVFQEVHHVSQNGNRKEQAHKI
jgi:hypothetical protein